MPAELLEETAAILGQQRKIKPTFGYYRQPNGWITVSPITRLEVVSYEEEGWENLTQYGSFDMTPYGASHPLEGLFMFGGAKELPVDQIIQMGLHLNPPMVPTCKQHITQFHRGHGPSCWVGAKPIEFPQLRDVPEARLKACPCEFCGRVLPTPEARKQHQQVMHAQERNNLQAGRSLAEAIAGTGNTSLPSDLTERLNHLERELAAAKASLSAGAVNQAALNRLAELEAADAARKAKLREHAKQYNQRRKAASQSGMKSTTVS